MEIIFEKVLSRIQNEMNKRDLSVYAFAKMLKIPQPTTDAYINGKRKPSLDFVFRVCMACGCSADYILGLTDNYECNINKPRENVLPHSYAQGMKKQIRVFKEKAEVAVKQATEFLKTVEEIEEGL